MCKFVINFIKEKIPYKLMAYKNIKICYFIHFQKKINKSILFDGNK